MDGPSFLDGCSPKYPAPKNLEPFSPKFLDEQEREWYNGFVAGCAAANGDPNGAQTRAASGLKLRRALASMRTALAAQARAVLVAVVVPSPATQMHALKAGEKMSYTIITHGSLERLR